MNLNWFPLMAPSPEGGGGGGSSSILMLVWMGLIFVVMYLLLIRPQRKRQKEHEALLKELKKGDRVVTNGGMFGTIFAIDEERNVVVLKTGDETKLEFLRTSIAGKVDK